MNYAFIQRPIEDGKRGHLRIYKNGFYLYLLITNIKTRMMQCYLTVSKDLLYNIIKYFIEKYGNKTTTDRAVHIDLVRELSKILEFKNTVKEVKFVLETTTSNSFFQNAVVEQNRFTLGNMIGCMLLGASFYSKYQLNALKYAV